MKKYLGFAVLFLMSIPVQAQNKNCPDCGTKPADDGAPTTWWSTSSAQVLSAPCLRKTPFTEEEMTSWLTEHRKAATGVSGEVKGFTFQDENPKLITAFRQLVDAPSFTAVKSSPCHRVLCAVQEVFGKKLGTQLLFMHERYGMNGSQYTNVNADAWKTDELDQVLIGLSAFPESLLPQETNKQLIHFARGYSLKIYGVNGVAVDANSAISIFDPWNDLPKGEQRMTIVHEVGHNLAAWNHSADSDPDWLKLSGNWTKKTTLDKDGNSNDEWTAHTPSRIVSKYGLTNPGEDFAETVSAYRFNPQELKKRNPEAYRLMKDVYFDGLEYTDEASCQESKSNFANVKKMLPSTGLAKTTVNPYHWWMSQFAGGLDQESIAKAEAQCGSFPLSQLGKTKPYRLDQDSEFLHCVRDQAKMAVFDQTMKKVYGAQRALYSSTLADQIPDSVISPAVIQQIVSTTKGNLRSVLQKSLKKYFDDANLIYDGDCDKGTPYAYLAVTDAAPEFQKTFSTNVVGVAYTYRDSFSALMTQACHEIQNQDHSLIFKKKKISDDEAAKIVADFFQ